LCDRKRASRDGNRIAAQREEVSVSRGERVGRVRIRGPNTDKTGQMPLLFATAENRKKRRCKRKGTRESSKVILNLLGKSINHKEKSRPGRISSSPISSRRRDQGATPAEQSANK